MDSVSVFAPAPFGTASPAPSSAGAPAAGTPAANHDPRYRSDGVPPSASGHVSNPMSATGASAVSNYSTPAPIPIGRPSRPSSGSVDMLMDGSGRSGVAPSAPPPLSASWTPGMSMPGNGTLNRSGLPAMGTSSPGGHPFAFGHQVDARLPPTPPTRPMATAPTLSSSMPQLSASAPSSASATFSMLEDIPQPGSSNRMRLGSTASSSSQGRTFFDTMQDAGLPSFPTAPFRAAVSGPGMQPSPSTGGSAAVAAAASSVAAATTASVAAPAPPSHTAAAPGGAQPPPPSDAHVSVANAAAAAVAEHARHVGTTFHGPLWDGIRADPSRASPHVFDEVDAYGLSLPFMARGGYDHAAGAADTPDEEMSSLMSTQPSDWATQQSSDAAFDDYDMAPNNPAAPTAEQGHADEDASADAGMETLRSQLHAAFAAADARNPPSTSPSSSSSSPTSAATSASPSMMSSSTAGPANGGTKSNAKSRRSTSSNKRDRTATALSRTPFVAGQSRNPSSFFIDVRATVLPHAALKWLLTKVESQEHSAKTCRYYMSGSPVCSACRDVFKAGRKLYNNDGAVKCLYRALRLQACMDVGMKFDAVGGGASQAQGKRQKMKRQHRGAGKRQCSVGVRMHTLLKALVDTAAAAAAAGSQHPAAMANTARTQAPAVTAATAVAAAAAAVASPAFARPSNTTPVTALATPATMAAHVLGPQ